MEPEKKEFRIKRKLTLIDSSMLIVGTMIGSGIFISPTWVLYYSGSVAVSLLVWLACGICSLLGALCIAELGTTIPKFGGYYIYLFEVFGPLPAFLYVWVLVIILTPSSIAIVLLVFAEYISYPVFIGCTASPQMVNRLLAVAAIAILTYLNCASVRWSARVTNVLSYTKLFALATIISIGLYYLAKGNTDSFEDGFANSTTSVGNIVFAMYSGLWAFTGLANLNSVTEEIKNVSRTLPLAIILSVTMVTVVYMLTNIAYFAVLSPAEILSADAVAVTFADSTMGVVAWMMPVFVALSTLGSASAIFFASGRVSFSGAREGQLPDLIAMIHVTRFTPIPALLLNAALALIMVQVSDIETLVNYFNFVSFLVDLAVVLGLLWWRYKKPELPRPLKLNLAIPILYTLITLFLVIVPLYTDPIVSMIGLGITLIGVPVYFATVVYKKKRPKVLAEVFGRVRVFFQKLFLVSPTNTDQAPGY